MTARRVPGPASAADAGRVVGAAVAQGRIAEADRSRWEAMYRNAPDETRVALAVAAPDRHTRSAPGARAAGTVAAATPSAPAVTGGWYATVDIAEVAVVPIFASGRDVPDATASGMEPAALRAVPYPYARLAVAEEPDRTRAFALLREFSGPGAEERAQADAGAPGSVVAAATDRFVARVKDEERRQMAVERERGQREWLNAGGPSGLATPAPTSTRPAPSRGRVYDAVSDALRDAT